MQTISQQCDSILLQYLIKSEHAEAPSMLLISSSKIEEKDSKSGTQPTIPEQAAET